MLSKSRDIRVKAVVVNTRAVGEMHKVITLLTCSDGLIEATLFGGRKGKKTALAPLFSFGTFQLYHNTVKNTYSLTDVDSEFNSTNIYQDLNATYTANYFCEVATKVSADDYERVYNLLVESLSLLEKNIESHRKLLIDFTWKIICISGLSTDLKTCPSCEKQLSEKEVLYFSNTLNSPVCESCADRTDLRLSSGSRRYLQYTQPLDIKRAFEVEIFPTTQQKLCNFLIPWVSYFCQNTLKTVKSGFL